MQLKSRLNTPPESVPNALEAYHSSVERSSSAAALPYPIVLQQRARDAMRGHVVRGFVRQVTLIAADVGALFVLKYALRAMRDSGVFGDAMQGVARVLLPKNTFYPYEFIAALVVGLTVAGTYGAGDRRRNVRSLLLGVTLGMALISWGRFWGDVTIRGSTSIFAGYSALSFFVFVSIVSAAVVSERLLIDRVVGWLRPMSASTTRVLAVGPAADCRNALARLFRRERGFSAVGYLNVEDAFDSDAVGEFSDIVWAISERRVDAIVLCGDMPPSVAGEAIRIADAAGCRVLAMRRLPKTGGLDPHIIWVKGEPIVQLSRPSLRGGQLLFKRFFDVTLGLLGMIVLSPLLLTVAIAVRLSSRGPIIFRQTRVGQGGRPFSMYKFRSMVREAEALKESLASRNIYRDERLFKVKADPRVTPVGRFLRRTSLDELPQLWNVMRGEMSLVGPRPPLLSELSLYKEHQYERFEMKPGVTGPWQVSGRNNITEFDEVIRLESEYMRGWSIVKDLEILVRTVPVVIRRDGAL